jgi:hypothetical protein
LIWFLGKEFNLDNFKNLLFEINLTYIFSALLILLISVYFRAVRWKILFNPQYNIDTKSLFDIQLIGYFGNNIFPLRFGEIMKSFILGNKFSISKSKVFGTIILERFLDAAGVLIIFFFSFIFSSYNYNFIYLYIISIFVLVIIFLSYFLKNIRFSNLKNNFIINAINDLISGFASLNNKNSILALFYTVLIWLCYILIVYLAQLSINFQLSFLDSMFILIVSTLWLAIPSAPAGIGTFEMGVKIALEVLGVTNSLIEFSIILHALTFFPYTLIGGYLFLKFYFNENNKI